MHPPEIALSQILGLIVAIYLSWLLSKIYHQAKWTRQTLKKRLSTYKEPYALPAAREPLHPEQYFSGDTHQPNCVIRKEWLPSELKRLDQR